eukprot:jgi/Tetstr1/455539/TSEL_042361.t1
MFSMGFKSGDYGAEDKEVMSAVFDQCWPRDTQIPETSSSATKAVSLPPAGNAASPKLHGLVGVLAHQQKRAGGIIKHNTNAVKNPAATQAIPGDNVDEGNSPEPPAKKAKQPAKPAAGVPARGRVVMGPGRAVGRYSGWGRAAVAAAGTREQQAGRRGAVPAETGCK